MYSSEYLEELDNNVINVESPSYDNSIQLTENEENQLIESGTSEQSLHKLNNIDTETSIKSEIKQLILGKVSEEINSIVLNNMIFEAQKEISHLNTTTDKLTTTIQELGVEIETDETRLAQSESLLMKKSEMINLLKENIEKLCAQHKDSFMNEISEKCLQQKEKLELLKNMYKPTLKKEQESIQNMKVIEKVNQEILSKESIQKEEKLKSLKKRLDELRNIEVVTDEEIQKLREKERRLREKLDSLRLKNEELENDFIKERDAYKDCFSPADDYMEKLNKTEEEIKEQICKEQDNLEKNKSIVDQLKNQVSAKKMELKKLKDKLEDVKRDGANNLAKLQYDYDSVCSKVDEVSKNITNLNSNTDNELNLLNQEFAKKCEKKIFLMNKNIEHQTIIHNTKINIIKKQMELEVEKTKQEELQQRYNTLSNFLNYLESNNTKEQDKMLTEVAELKAKLKEAENEHSKYFVDVKNRKEYCLANSKFYEDKSANLQNEINKEEILVKNLREENTSLNSLLAEKQRQIEECKNKLTVTPKSPTEPKKSILKSPTDIKKVTFNDILSFKSVTSSEDSKK